MASAPTIVVFDSGLGGLTVHREVVKARPDARLIYVADDAGFPYGPQPEPDLVARVTDVIAALIEAHRPDLIVIACNTASTLVLPHLRDRFTIPFVGTVPAIKPACAVSVSRRVSVLGTIATVKREYTHALIREFGAGCEVTLVGSPELAVLAEAELNGRPATDAVIAAEIAPCFVGRAEDARTDAVVLACTHYPLLLDRFRALAPWPVTWIDPAPAIGRRVSALLGPSPDAAGPARPARILFTSGRPASPNLRTALTGFGIAETAHDLALADDAL